MVPSPGFFCSDGWLVSFRVSTRCALRGCPFFAQTALSSPLSDLPGISGNPQSRNARSRSHLNDSRAGLSHPGQECLRLREGRFSANAVMSLETRIPPIRGAERFGHQRESGRCHFCVILLQSKMQEGKNAYCAKRNEDRVRRELRSLFFVVKWEHNFVSEKIMSHDERE